MVVGIPALFTDIGWAADLTNIGTFFAFVLVCGVLMLRRRAPERPRPFRCPGAPWTPLLGIAMCLGLMISLPVLTWIRFVVWLVIGLVIYRFYGRSHSHLNQERAHE